VNDIRRLLAGVERAALRWLTRRVRLAAAVGSAPIVNVYSAPFIPAEVKAEDFK